MDHTEERVRLVGDYILGPKIGSGSFAVVWLSKHQVHGYEVAIKEIDKKHLSRKVHDSLLKEIDILRNIRHPNIIQFHEDIQTADKIFLVLEFCTGGDLAAYIQRFGRVSEAVARHFMRQLASGLQVLRENNLIHRDLKPQNLLLSTNDEFPILKIGDFGFARYLMPQRLADTLCGSPLYMAPEIIQNQKYDAKADLWSVGAILFQLVTGKPPFDGNSQFQLFQNILTSSELQFPQSIMKELHPDCIDLCKCLLRQNPVERLTFEEFFNHKFMAELRPAVRAKFTSPLVESRTLVEGEGSRDDKLPFASDDRPQLHLESSSYSSNPRLIACPKLNPADDNPRKSADGDPSISLNLSTMKNESVDRGLFSISTLKVADSLESIEQEYVLVNANFASMETLSSSLEVSMQDHSAARFPSWPPKKIGKGIAVSVQSGELAVTSVCGVESLGSHASAPLAASQASTESGDVQKTSSLHPSTRLRLLHQYGHALSELAEEKLNAGLNLESFSVELVALAVWREALRACILWGASATVECLPSSSANECPPDQEIASLSLNSAQGLDFNRPSSVCSWAEQGFLVAFDQAEKISSYLRDMDGSAEMPDAMEIIFQTALAAGKSGGVDELMGNRSSAATSYSKAMVLLSFILEEATSLPLNPPFSLTVSDQQRIHKYIINLKAHLSQSQSPDPSSIT